MLKDFDDPVTAKMKIDKSLQEVWNWKDKVYKDTKDLSMKDTVKNIHRGAEEFCKKYNLKFKTLQPAHK